MIVLLQRMAWAWHSCFCNPIKTFLPLCCIRCYIISIVEFGTLHSHTSSFIFYWLFFFRWNLWANKFQSELFLATVVLTTGVVFNFTLPKLLLCKALTQEIYWFTLWWWHANTICTHFCAHNNKRKARKNKINK